MPVLEQLGPLHNFSVESQVRFESLLAFDLAPKDDHWIVDNEQLSVFVNSEEWSFGTHFWGSIYRSKEKLKNYMIVSGVTQDHVLHFIVFVPSLHHRPLFIERLEG